MKKYIKPETTVTHIGMVILAAISGTDTVNVCGEMGSGSAMGKTYNGYDWDEDEEDW